MTDDERTNPAPLRPRNEPIPEPIRNIREYVSAVLLRPQENLVASEAAHVEESHIGNPEAGIEHYPDEILDVLARVHAVLAPVEPGDLAETVAGR